MEYYKQDDILYKRDDAHAWSYFCFGHWNFISAIWANDMETALRWKDANLVPMTKAEMFIEIL